MATKTINLVQNDNNIKLVFTITKDSQMESILGSRVFFQMKRGTLEIKRECTITDPSIGEAMYVLTDEDLAIPGTYQTEVQVEYPNGTRLTNRNPVFINITAEVVPGTD